MSGPRFDMLYWIFVYVTAETRRTVAGPYLDRDEAEAQASMVGGYAVGVDVAFIADRSRVLPPVDF